MLRKPGQSSKLLGEKVLIVFKVKTFQNYYFLNMLQRSTFKIFFFFEYLKTDIQDSPF